MSAWKATLDNLLAVKKCEWYNIFIDGKNTKIYAEKESFDRVDDTLGFCFFNSSADGFREQG